MMASDSKNFSRMGESNGYSSRTRTSYIRVTVIFGLLGVWGTCDSQCHAQISFLNMDRNNTYLQTGDSTVSYNGSFFAAGLNSINPGDFDSVVMDYPGAGSPVNVPPFSTPDVFLYGSPTLPSQAAMDSAYPVGTYAFTADGSLGSAERPALSTQATPIR